MRTPTWLFLVCTAGVFGAPARGSPDAAVTLRLVDGATRKALAGLVAFRDATGRPVRPEGLLSRRLGIPDDATRPAGTTASEWWVLPGPVTFRVPRQKLTVETFSGLETEIARIELDTSTRAELEVTIPLVRFYDAGARGQRGANTHLHLKDIGREAALRYLNDVPRGDGLDVLFVSHLERPGADAAYVSNSLSADDLRKLSSSGTLFGNGEEHRHNFGGFDEGYGHVMFLDLKKLVRPVSIGAGIMKAGPDAPPLRQGIDEARRQGASVVWCHNMFGLEDIPNWVMGRPHAQNIFDGAPDEHGSYKDTFYRYLNAGLHVPFSTGTDWFIDDFSRAYARVEKLTVPRDWLRALAAGRSFITNGPFLEFQVAGLGPGETVKLSAPGHVRVAGRAVGRVDFGRIELVLNEVVMRRGDSVQVMGHFEADLGAVELEVAGPGWLALRIPPEGRAKNEMGRTLFAHTSPVYLAMAGKTYFDPIKARGLIDDMTRATADIEKKAIFANAHERQHVLEVYKQATAILERRLR